jgi:hypothetical protein
MEMKGNPEGANFIDYQVFYFIKNADKDEVATSSLSIFYLIRKRLISKVAVPPG